MKTSYYDDFSCIADNCSFTCCQEWKIAIDDDTYTKWKHLSVTNQENDSLDRYVTQKDGARVIALNEQKQCPFLKENKLCKLVLELGDEVLSKTCASFPRQIHEFADRKEYSLASCCPEAVDFMNRQDSILFTETMSDAKDGVLLQIRTMMITIMQKQQFSISKCLMVIFYILLDLNQKDVVLPKEINEYLKESVLKEFSDTIDKMKFHRLDTFEENNELFLDTAENYRKQELYTKYLEPIALMAEKLSEEYNEQKLVKQLEQFDKEFASYETLFRNYMVVEIFSNCLMPESNLEDMIVMFEWIAMEYAIMRHAIFLNWMVQKESALSYDEVRSYIVVISRMMGYDQEDVCEFLEKSFESLLWEWGYLALLVGAE